MSMFFMFGEYSAESVRKITAERTQEAVALFESFGGKVKEMYALLGPYDLVFIVDLPGTQEAMKASVKLSKATGITFTSCPAMTVEHFDKLMAEN
ncbi:MAG: GYD domain-containing protein [Candidatus Hydrogenedentota bacterium]